MSALTIKQYLVLQYLVKACVEPATPTEIGEACRKPYYTASSWASSALKALIKNGLVERSEAGAYYHATDAGRAALSQHEGDR